MIDNIFIGILLIATGAFSSGSFAVPFSNIRHWSWENYWMIYSISAYMFLPLITCIIFTPNFLYILKITPANTIVEVFGLGIVYGIGNLSFGLSLRYLGLSLGYSISLGLMLVIGTLIPPFIDGRLTQILSTSGGKLLIIGIILAMSGVIMSAWAGFLKDKFKNKINKDFSFFKGFIMAMIVGVAGSAMALGFEKGYVINKIAEQVGVNPLFSSMPVYLILLSGTFLITLFWCSLIGLKNKSFLNYVITVNNLTLIKNYGYALFAGLLWFSQFIFFGMGKSKMGEFTFTSWGILMSLTISFASIWGLILGEWKGVSTKVYLIMISSTIILVISSFIIGISGSI